MQKVEEAKAAEEAKKEEAGLGKVAKKKKKATRESVMELLNVETIEMEIGYRLVPLLDVEQGGDLLERIAQIRRQTALDLGIVLPSIRVERQFAMHSKHLQIKLKGVPIESERYILTEACLNAGRL